MTRLASILLSILTAAAASGQATRVAPRGELSGVELTLEGRRDGVRGATLRWLGTVYEVRGLTELRPAAGASLHLRSSLAPDAEPVEVTSDGAGHVVLEVPIPEDAVGRFQVQIEIRHRDVVRRFTLPIDVALPRRVELFAARSAVRAGGPLRVVGRVLEAMSGAPADDPVRLTLRGPNGGPLLPPVDVEPTAGLFAHTFRLPSDAPNVHVEAEVRVDRRMRARTQVSVAVRPAHPAGGGLQVAVAPDRALVEPGTTVGLTVVVRTAEGVPVPGATVRLPGRPQDDDIAEGREARTDARGRAALRLETPQVGAGVRELTPTVEARAPGRRAGSGQGRLRVVADRHALGYAVEGGALVPELGGRVFVRAVDPLGAPAAGVPVTLAGARLDGGPLTRRSDDDGVAVFDVRLRRAASDAVDRCGGDTSTAIEVSTPGRASPLRGCLPLDPDGTVRVRVDRSAPTRGGRVVFTVARTPAVRRLPVLLSLFHPTFGGVAQRIVPSGEDRLEVALPADFVDLVHVRARPILGRDGRVLRGGATALYVLPGDAHELGLTVARGRREIGVDVGYGEGPARAWAVALPIDEALALEGRLGAATPGLDLRRPMAGAGEALLQGAVATRVQRDTAASFLYREGRAIAQPLPGSDRGLLRDPWRAQARFVTGRLARLYRAIEATVDGALQSGRLEDVAVETRGRWDFNDRVLEAAAASLGPDGAAGLGGEPLTIEALRRFDSSLTYDRVAGRITRERLFRLILGLRQMVQSRGLDLAWARLALETDAWFEELANRSVNGQALRRVMLDGWGRPFALRPRSGQGFDLVTPLEGYELRSAGPDGRFGTRDDVVDPTARIVPSGTPYADAMGEDLLVARMDGVELGRATLQALNGALSVGLPGVPRRSDAVAPVDEWSRHLPSRWVPDPDPTALRRPGRPGDGAGGQTALLAGGRGHLDLRLDDEPRTWGVVVVATDAQGQRAVALERLQAGAPILLEGPRPRRLWTGDRITLPMSVTDVSGEAGTYRVEAIGDGLEVEAPGQVDVPREASTALPVQLRATGAGPATVELQLRDGAGEVARRLRWRLRVAPAGHPLRRSASGRVDGTFRATLAVPSSARQLQARVVVLAPPALDLDPDLTELRRARPSLPAWAAVMAGRGLDPALRALLLRLPPQGGLDGACAQLALAALADEDEEARRRLVQQRGVGYGSGGVAVDAATLVALAAGDAGQGGPGGPAGPLAAQLRQVLRQTPDDVTALAEAGSALLLADPEDSYGRAMVQRALERLPEAEDVAVRARYALALAARVLGDDRGPALAAAAIADDRPVAWTSGDPTPFWRLAAGVYGAFGPAAERAVVRGAGRTEEVTLGSGTGVVTLPWSPGESGTVEVSVPDDGVAYARVEAVYEAPMAARQDSPLRLAIDGDEGDRARGGALELTLSAEDADVEDVVLEIQLPTAWISPSASPATAASGASRASCASWSPASRPDRACPSPCPWRGPSRARSRGSAWSPTPGRTRRR
jgi:hypothetical protein